MDNKKEVMEAIKTYGSLAFIGLLLPYIAGSILVSIGVINSVGVFEFSADAHATRYFAGLVSLMLASVVYLGGRYAIVLIVAYPLSVLLLGFGAIQNPTRNITDIDLIITLVVLILVTIAALPFIILIHFARKQKRKEVTYTSEPSKESDNQENNEDVVPQIVSFPTGKKIMTSVVIIAVLFSSVLLVSSNYHSYEEYSGGKIGCHIPNPTYQSNIQEGEVVSFSSLNEVDKKIFRMAINDSYLVSVRDDLSETEEYTLLVTKDRGYDEIIIYEGGVEGSQYFPPPDGLSSEPTMDISGSEYFSGGFEEKPNVRYQGETYWCLMDEFYVQGA